MLVDIIETIIEVGISYAIHLHKENKEKRRIAEIKRTERREKSRALLLKRPIKK